MLPFASDANQVNHKEHYKTRIQTMNEENLPALPIPHCPVVIVLDTSHSMWGRGMQDQQDALKAFHKTLGALGFDDSRIEIAAVGMGDDLRLLQSFRPLAESTVATAAIRPKGDTPIGGALRLALDELRRWIEALRLRGEGIATPQLLILSDGKSSDDFSSEAAEIRREVEAGRLNCRAVATGENPDLGALARIAGENVDRPDYGRLRETFARIGEKVSQTYEDAVPGILMANAVSSSPGPECKSVAPESGRPPVSVSKGSRRLAGRTILVDGTNVCFWNRNAASLVPVLALAKVLDAEGADWQACFDASTRHHLSKGGTGEAALYEELLRTKPDRFAEAPTGIQADIFLLEAAAAERRSVVITNDRFRDHEERFPFVKKERHRFAPGGIFRSQLCVPALGIRCAIMSVDSADTVIPVTVDDSPSGSVKTELQLVL